MANYTPYNLQSKTDSSYWAKIVAKKVLVYVVCIFLTLLCVLPFIIMFLTATKNNNEINSGILEWIPNLDNKFLCSLLPSNHIEGNWNALFNNESLNLPIGQGFINSALIALSATVLTVYFSAMTAYGFTVYHFKGSKILYGFILAIMMVPTQVSAMGFIEMVARVGWNDTYWPLIFPAIAAPSTVFFLRQYMQSSLSIELVEAGRMDGCSEFGIYNKLVTPILVPGLATQAIFAMVANWNNFFMPLLILNSKEKYTIPILVSLLTASKYRTIFGSIYLGLSLATLPLIVFYLILSKYIIAGVALGGVKE